MPSLHVPLHSFRAKHPAIEGEFFPRFKANHPISAHFQLNAALLAAKTAMRLYQALGGIARFVLPAARRGVRWVRAEALQQNIGRDGRLSHAAPPSVEAAPKRATFSCRPGIAPAMWCSCLQDVVETQLRQYSL